MKGGHHVTLAFTGMEFLSIMKQQVGQTTSRPFFDAVLVNLLMGKMDVPQTIRWQI